MLYEAAAGGTIVVCTITIIAQLTLVCLLLRHNDIVKLNVQKRMNTFQILSEQANAQLAAMRRYSQRTRREIKLCNPYEPGPPGPPGDDAEDGEQGEDGPDGPRGMDAREIMQEMGEKCIVCPRGAVGPMGPPGNPGPPGAKGDKGPPGIPAIDGRDGEMGPEGPPGINGTAGRPGPKGPPGRPAPGGTGAPGPKGLPGPIGRTGPQGERGKRNFVYGPPGPDGKPGVNGMDGLVGSFGRRGEKGMVGEPGANAKFCPCPIELQLINAHNQFSEGNKATDELLNKVTIPQGKNGYSSKSVVISGKDEDAILDNKVEYETRRVQHHLNENTVCANIILGCAKPYDLFLEPQEVLSNLPFVPNRLRDIKVPGVSERFMDFTIPQTLPTVPPLPEEFRHVERGEANYPTASVSIEKLTNAEPPTSSGTLFTPIVSIPDLSSILPDQNYKIRPLPTSLAFSSRPLKATGLPILPIRRTVTEKTTPFVTASTTSITTEDPVKAHPLRGTEDLSSQNLRTFTQPSAPTEFDGLDEDVAGLAVRVREFLNNENMADITLDVLEKDEENEMEEERPTTIGVDTTIDENELISDETRSFSGVEVNRDTNEGTQLFQATSDILQIAQTSSYDGNYNVTYSSDDGETKNMNMATTNIPVRLITNEDVKQMQQDSTYVNTQGGVTPAKHKLESELAVESEKLKDITFPSDETSFPTEDEARHLSQDTTNDAIAFDGTSTTDASAGLSEYSDDRESTTNGPKEIITGYIEETALPTRRRFIYVTKRPIKSNE